MAFTKWLKTFLQEKQIDLSRTVCVNENSGVNHIPYGVVVEHIQIAHKEEQAAIKAMLVRIDFANGNIYDFLGHLAQAIAV